jgi:hypothetical protein
MTYRISRASSARAFGARAFSRRAAGRGLVLTLCITLFTAACGGSDRAAGPGAGVGGGDDNSPSSRVPDELVGAWYAGDVSPTEFYDPNTGSWGGQGYSEGVYYRFAADGHYDFGYQLASELYGCGTRTLFYVTGTMTVDETAGVFELHPTSAKKIEQNSCSGKNTETPFEGEGESNYYEVRQDDAGHVQLWVRATDGHYDWSALNRVDQ